jgi:hypothetical protein
VSAELRLRTHPAYRAVTFAAGLHLQPPSDPDLPPAAAAGRPPAEGPRVLLSYGAGDASGRVLTLTLDEVERLFAAGPAPASAPAGAGAGGGVAGAGPGRGGGPRAAV